MPGFKRTAESPLDRVAKLKRVHAKADDQAPLAVYMATRLPPQSPDAEWSIVRRDGSLHVDGSVGEVNYASQAMQGAATASRLAVGVLDKETGVLRYCEVAGGALLRVQPHHVQSLEELQGTPSKLDGKARAQAQNALTRQFGSERAKRQLEQRLAAGVNVDTLGSAAERGGGFERLLDEAANQAQAKGTSREAVTALLESQRNIPPHHLEATTAAEAYKVEELVPDSCMKCLGHKDLFQARGSAERLAELQQQQRWPTLVLEQLASIAKPEPGVEQPQLWPLMKALALLGNLLNLLAAPKRLTGRKQPSGLTPLEALAKQHHIQPEKLLAGLLVQHYSHAESPDGNQHYSQSDVQRTRLTLYALTAALLAKDGKLGPSMLSGLRGALKIPQPTLTKLLRELGCTVTRVTGTSGDATQHNAVLMGAAKPGSPKTLGQCLPQLKAGRGQR